MTLRQDVTLSVVSHGHGPLLWQLLDDLNSQAALSSVRVFVTLNQRGEEFDSAQWPNLDILLVRNESPRGFGTNHNAAFAMCDTPWFAVLNPDLRLSGGEPFTHMLSLAKTVEGLGVMAPLVVGEDGSQEDSVRSNLTPWSLVSRRLLTPRITEVASVLAGRDRDFYWLAGMCLMLNATAMRKIGAFDERFFLYCEDYDLCARMYNAGYKLALDKAVRIVHIARRDSHRSLRHLFWHLTSLGKVWTSQAFWRLTLSGHSVRPPS